MSFNIINWKLVPVIMLDDTIIAISTPPGCGGLGIVRLSGNRALFIAQKIFRRRRKTCRKIEPQKLLLGDIYDYVNKEVIDEGYLAYFAEPNSYTRENMVEISCHGSPLILGEVVRLGIKAGARHARPGEFTLRAYLHGRIDVLQAEAVNDMIMAASLKQAKISCSQMRGRFSKRIGWLRQKVILLLSQVEARIEFPEERLRLSLKHIAKTLESVISNIKSLVDSYETGRILTEGLTLALVGKANVGKSTLFNALINEDRAIVSPYPGTTRDYLRERIRIKDSLFHLIDMAGLERPSHPLEREGIRRGEEWASRADGILLILDSSRPETQADLRLIRKFKDKRTVLVFNKSDLLQRIDKARCWAINNSNRWLDISALKGTNLHRLKEMIHETFILPEAEEDTVLHLRQKLLLEQTLDGLKMALRFLKEGHSEEVFAEEIRQILPLIGQLTGEIKVDEVMEDIFSRFCVGK